MGKRLLPKGVYVKGKKYRAQFGSRMGPTRATVNAALTDITKLRSGRIILPPQKKSKLLKYVRPNRTIYGRNGFCAVRKL